MRRGVAERSETEMKRKEDQKEILRQKEQISHLESISKRQLEGAQNTCSQEKVRTAPTGSLIGDKLHVKPATIEVHCKQKHQYSCG